VSLTERRNSFGRVPGLSSGLRDDTVAEATHDGAGANQRTRGIFRHHAVVDARCSESAIRREQEGKAPAQKEADHPDLTRAAILLGQPSAYGLDIVERLPLRRRMSPKAARKQVNGRLQKNSSGAIPGQATRHPARATPTRRDSTTSPYRAARRRRQ
jgi:hypothetical protein